MIQEKQDIFSFTQSRFSPKPQPLPEPPPWDGKSPLCFRFVQEIHEKKLKKLSATPWTAHIDLLELCQLGC
jgi:hypothetical protein